MTSARLADDPFAPAPGRMVGHLFVKKVAYRQNLFHQKSDEEPYILVIPKRTLHGFMVVSKTPAVLLNFPTALYSPQEEGRVPYSVAKVKSLDGELFNWDKVRKEFPDL